MLRSTLILILFLAFQAKAQNNNEPLNAYRVLASHNSYKLKPDPRVSRFLKKIKNKLGEENDPIQLEYAHELLSVQLDSFNVRGFELDVYADPKGGKYYKRRINGFVRGKRKRSKVPVLKEPGFKIIHISDVDYETNYFTLQSALEEIVDWSKNNPDHSPVYINIEAKGSGMGNESGLLRFLGFKKAIAYDSTTYDQLNKELLTFVPSQQLLTPKEFQGDYGSIRERIDSIGWPSIEEFKGKLFFILEGNRSEWYATQLNAGADLPMFVYGHTNDPMTLFVRRNQPIGNEEEIKELSKDFIVRTRTDAGTLEARANDQSRKEAAIRSGAQIVSTDYYRPDLELSEFSVTLEEILKK